MKHVLVMPDGDTRKARVHWSEQKGDVMELCISVDHDEPAWQRMDSAPKDGTRILVFAISKDDPYDRPSTIAEAWWGNEGGTEIAHWMGLGLTDWHRPTHWMPLPDAPV